MLCASVARWASSQLAAWLDTQSTEGWGSTAPELRIACAAWDQTTADIQEDFPVQRGAGHNVLTQKQSISSVEGFLVGGHCRDVT